MTISWKITIVFFILISCGDGYVKETHHTNRSSIKPDSVGQILTFHDSITNVNYWEVQDQLDKLVEGNHTQEAYELALKIDKSDISYENRLSFYSVFFSILMNNSEYDRAMSILRTRYMEHPFNGVSHADHLFVFYYWSTVIKLGDLQCDSARFFFKELNSLPMDSANLSLDNVGHDISSISKLIEDNCK